MDQPGPPAPSDSHLGVEGARINFFDLLVNGAVALIRAAPSGLKQAAASAVAHILFAFWSSRRRAAIHWTSRALGMPPEHRQTVATARQTWINFAKFSIDFVESCTTPRRELVESKLKFVRNGATVAEIAREKRGCLFISAHVGNWELLGIWVSLFNRRFHVVALPLDSPALNRFAERTRALNGFNLIDTRGGARHVLRALKRGEWVAILADRSVAHRGEPVTFLGRPGVHPVGLVRIARRAGVPVIFGGCWSNGTGRYEAELLPVLRTDDPAVSTDELIDRTVKNVEHFIRRHPDQWYIAYTSGPEWHAPPP